MKIFNIDGLKLTYNNGNELIIKKTIFAHLSSIAITIFTIVILCVFINSWKTQGNVELVVIIIFVSTILYNIYKPLKALILKEQYSFDLSSQLFYQNKNLKASFIEIEFVEIIRCSGEDSSTYLLNIRLKDKTSVQIDDSSNKKEIYRVAGEIASFINKEVKTK